MAAASAGGLLQAEQCQRLMANEMLVVAPDHGLIWCPNAKVGTTTWYEILRRRLMPWLRSMPRCFPSACPDRGLASGPDGGQAYPLMLPRTVPGNVRLCDRRRFVSFTFVRNPWDRLASAYMSKIERGTRVRDRQALAVQQRIRTLFGLRRGQHIRFGQFVRWVVQQNTSTMNPHWKPHSERCDTLYTPYEFIGRYETLQEDILHVLGMLGWSPSLIPATHWSSLTRTSMSRANQSERLLRLYDSQLVDLIAQKYRDDSARPARAAALRTQHPTACAPCVDYAVALMARRPIESRCCSQLCPLATRFLAASQTSDDGRLPHV